MAYWAVENWQVVYEDERTYSLTFTDAAGDPVDVSAWTTYYKAESDYTTDTVAITSTGGGITYTDSGTGTTDTVNIKFAETDSDITVGKYSHHLVAVVSSATVTLIQGTLTIVEAQAAVA